MEIVALVKESGQVTGYKLSNGQTVSKEEGVNLAKAGEIKGVGVAHRNIYKSQFNYLWVSLLPGIKSTLLTTTLALSKEERQEVKSVRKEERKAAHQKKKEDKKAK